MRSKFYQNRDFGLRVKDSKLGFWLGLRISNLVKFSIFIKIKILKKNQNSATVVYHNFDISQNYRNQNFLKLTRIWTYNRDKLFSKIFKSIWTKISPKSPKIPQNWLKSPKFSEKILKTWRWESRPKLEPSTARPQEIYHHLGIFLPKFLENPSRNE